MEMSLCIRQPIKSAYANTKDADQLCSNCTADQRLCFRSTDIPRSKTNIVIIACGYPGLLTSKPDMWIKKD